MKTTLRISSVVIFVMLLGIGIHHRGALFVVEPTAQAATYLDDSFSAPCSAQTIKGSYGISTTGSIVSAGPIGLVGDVGVITFDGTVGVAQTSTVSLNGAIILSRSSVSGSYEVDGDCTGEISLVLPTPTGTTTSTSRFVIVHNGEELMTVVTGAGRVLTGTAKRQHPRFW